MKKAFTLIELLIVIAIIGILSTVVVTYAVPARYKANDTKALSLVSNAQKIASICTTAGYSLSATITEGSSICSVSTAANGVWPTISNIKSSNGGSMWAWTSVASSTDDFTMIATAGSGGSAPKITCTFSGCSKLGF